MRTPISAPITLLTLTLLGVSSGCDADESIDPAELQALEGESEGLDEGLDELPEALEPDDFDPDVDPDFDPDFDPEDVELIPEIDPQAVYAGWVGGSGGSLFTRHCPNGMTGIGITAASSGQYVRQLGLVCAPEYLVEGGFNVGAEVQEVISTGYYNSGSLVAPADQPRLTFDASAFNPLPWLRYKAPGTVYRVCDAGYRLNKIDVRSGALVDRIQSITCWWDGPGGQGPRGLIYSTAVNIGGTGGSFGSSSCQSTSEKFVNGVQFRSGWLLDGFRIDCNE